MTAKTRKPQKPTTSHEIVAILTRKIADRLDALLSRQPMSHILTLRDSLPPQETELHDVLTTVIDVLSAYTLKTHKLSLVGGQRRELKQLLANELVDYADQHFDEFVMFWIVHALLERDCLAKSGGIVGEVSQAKLAKDLKRLGFNTARLQGALFRLLRLRVFKRIERGKQSSLDEVTRARILATYNRYLLVIQNARAYARGYEKKLRRDRVRDARRKAEEVAAERYMLGDLCSLNMLFSDDLRPSDLAKQIVHETHAPNYTLDYFTKVLLSETKKWQRLVRKGCNEPDMHLIDLHGDDYGVIFYYAIGKNDKNAGELLKFVSRPPLSLGLHPHFLGSKIVGLTALSDTENARLFGEGDPTLVFGPDFPA